MAKRAVKFAEHLYENVLQPVPHRHVVFTIPKRLRGYFRYDRNLNSILFNAAWGAVIEALGGGGSVPAAVLTLQTAGEALNFTPTSLRLRRGKPLNRSRRSFSEGGPTSTAA